MIMNPAIYITTICLALVLLSCLPHEGSEAAMTIQGPVPPPVIVVKSALTLEAIKLAEGDTETALERLRSMLIDKKVLLQINTEREYLALYPDNLQLYFILEALARNPASRARILFGDLAANPLYAYPGSYQAVLLEASVHVNKPAPGLVTLWQAQLQPDASELHRTVDVVIKNGSMEAINLFEHMLLENRYREDFVVAWFRGPILRHRQDLMLLEACERLIQSSGWPARLKRFLVEALYDYHPGSWYQIDVEPPRPPSRDKLNEQSRNLLRMIAKIARDQKLIGSKRFREIQNELSPR